MSSKNEQPLYKWLGMHIFYSGNADQLLKRFIAPFVSTWKSFLSPVSPWFFIRYWEQGSHIRLRFLANPADHDRMIAALNRDILLIQSDEFKVERVVEVEYQPEINRYGNHESIGWAEQQFAASSAWILNWLFIKNTSSQITMQAIRLHLLQLFCTRWDLEKLLNICDFFIDGWLPRLYRSGFSIEDEKKYWLNQFQLALSSPGEMICLAAKSFWRDLGDDNIPDDLAQLKINNAGVMEHYQNAGFEDFKLREIISSLMHMTNNRLGIANHEEAYLMYVVKICISSIHQTNHSI